MPFYMWQGSYTTAAIKAMVDNPHDRMPAGKALVESAGGTLHQLFFCMGSEDVVAIAEAPDDAAMASVSFALGASGAFSAGRTTKLMTTTEAVSAMKAAQGVLKGYKPATG
jgi:uncharacterized protein with GYD domain